MNNLTNYHSHTQFCDGHAGMEEFVVMAIRLGFTSYGFSPHAPLPFPTHWTMKDANTVAEYLAEFKRLKEKYKNTIELYAGMEIDYLNKESNPANDFFQHLPLDYRIGSVHMLYNEDGKIVDIDSDGETFKCRLDQYFHNDLEHVVRLYYSRLLEMIDTGGFDFIGHADKISNNADFCRPGIREEGWYIKIMQNYFEAIAANKLMVEINTKQFHKFGCFYPNQKYFTLLKDLKIPVVVNSDAHYPDLINDGREEALKALYAAGIRSVIELEKGCWVEKEIGL